MLLFLTSWEERGLGTRSWKGYDFGILNELNDEQLISGGKKTKSVYITDDGVSKVKQLLKDYNLINEKK